MMSGHSSCDRRRARTSRVWIAVGAGCIAAASLWAADPVPPSVPDRQADAVLAHLNTGLAWYRLAQQSNTWVVQASDAFYRDNQRELTNEVMLDAFAYARAMAGVIGAEGQSASRGTADTRKQRLTARISSNTAQLADLKAQDAALTTRIAAASPADRAPLTAQQEVVQAHIELDEALADTLEKSISLFANAGETDDSASLPARVAALQQAEPEIFDVRGSAQAKKQAPPPLPSQSDGLVNRAATLFSLIKYQRSLDLLAKRTMELQASANALAEPIANRLRAAIKTGDDATLVPLATEDAAQLEQLRDRIDRTAAEFRNLAAALLPLREEAMALDHTHSNLTQWKASIVAQTDIILRVLFTRSITLIVVLVVLFGISEGWRRATFRYVHDARRRRQFLLVRRFATSILMVVVIVMGFVSDFSSLATFAGFITAGIAVALQTIILSIAAYFFLIGRYGVKVGDRVTVSGVTGDVIDIGLVRVFLMELAGTGVDLHPTGRVVVLANSSLFSSTPVYKQLPGTNYAWHEIFVVVPPDADIPHAKEVMLKAVESVYHGYRSKIEEQHGALERLLDYKTELPVPSAHIRLADTGIEVVIRYPAEIRTMSEVDENVSREVLAAIRGDEVLKKAVSSQPMIRAAVKS